MKIDKKILDLAKKLKIKIVFDKEEKRATCDARLKSIILNPKRATNYDALHEISHVICGYGCCREHCEFEAHGGAKVLCKLLGLSKGNAEVRMDSYAGRTSSKACGRIEKLKKGGRK